MVVVKGVGPGVPMDARRNFRRVGEGKPKKGPPYIRTKKGPYIPKKVAKRLPHEEKKEKK